MARVVVKNKFMKPGKRTPGRYAKYIDAREGGDKIDDSAKLARPRPRELSYGDYIATRPRAEKIGKHGLFTDDGIEVDLGKVSQDLNNFGGTIWTAIVSIKRVDVAMLGFETGERWRNIVRAHRDEVARYFKINPETLCLYGAFRNESYHPHIHLIIYDRENKGFINEEGVENINSMFAHAFFKDEIEAVIGRIHEGIEDNLVFQSHMIDLSERLKACKGKKQYGYLTKND